MSFEVVAAMSRARRSGGRALLALVFVSFFCGTACAQDPTEPLVMQKTNTDLDGDGHPDYIRAAFYQVIDGEYDRVVLEINGTLLATHGINMQSEFQVVDVNASDPYREIAISEWGPSGDYATHFFRYSTGAITELGTLPGFLGEQLTVDGSNTVQTRCRGTVLQTWFYPCVFRLDPRRGRFEKVSMPWKPMNTAVTLKVDLDVQAAPDVPGRRGSSVRANAPPSSTRTTRAGAPSSRRRE